MGKNQSRQVAEKIKNTNLDIVFISELPRINDRKTGYDSKPVSDFFEALKSDIFNLKFNYGESFQEEKERVFSFLEELKTYNYSNVLVVTHSEILQLINGYYNKLSDKEMWSEKIDNCQVLEINL